jgi:DNA-binding LacI/PurR family transcriptional regulator
VTQHLVDLGHQTVHHVCGPPTWPEAQLRAAGWRQTLRAAGRTVPRVLAGDWSPHSGYLAGQRLAVDPRVTAVFCANDQMAIGVLRALTEAGRAVPREVSVVGFDDIPEAPYLLPPLTTVRQDFAELGQHSMQLLVTQISTGVRTDGHVRFPPRLVVRDSAATPNGAVKTVG